MVKLLVQAKSAFVNQERWLIKFTLQRSIRPVNTGRTRSSYPDIDEGSIHSLALVPRYNSAWWRMDGAMRVPQSMAGSAIGTVW